MVGEGLRLLLLSIGRWIGSRMTELVIAAVAVIFFAVALILGSVAAHQALVPAVGQAMASAYIAIAYLLLGGIAIAGWYTMRRRRQRIARATNWAAAVPRPTPGLMLAALVAGAVLGTPTSRKR
jgi:hypothetical protein